MSAFFLNVLLALAWVALTGEFTPLNLAIGFVIGLGALWLTRRNGGQPGYVRKVGIVIGFATFFLWELVLANLRMALLVLKPHGTLRPGIVAVPLDLRSESQVALLANFVTLTPGTLSLDISDDRQVLYVHAVDVPDAEVLRHAIKHGFERRIKELFT